MAPAPSRRSRSGRPNVRVSAAKVGASGRPACARSAPGVEGAAAATGVAVADVLVVVVGAAQPLKMAAANTAPTTIVPLEEALRPTANLFHMRPDDAGARPAAQCWTCAPPAATRAAGYA